MASLSDLLQTGAASIGLLLSSALVLGALHGLEPGHSKTMMTAFIIAVRGTVAQAALLGLAATVSHTAVVWVVALLGLHFASRYDAAFAEPYFQVASAVLILAIASWMLWRTWRQQRSVRVAAQQHRHDDGDHHSHRDAHQLAHADEIRRRFASANVTTGQIVMLGLSGGLIPCSAAVAVLALCLQINQLWLGIALVACFSIGLAVTLVAAGIIAAVGMRHASRRWSGLGDLARRAPYLSGIVMIGVGLYVGWEGWTNVSIAL
jgi:ABC-type nickel/cobalt efflux system permease component RcnA